MFAVVSGFFVVVIFVSDFFIANLWWLSHYVAQWHTKVRVKVHSTIATCHLISAVISDRASLGCSSSPRLQTLARSLAALCSPSLPFSDLHLRNTCKYMDYYSYTDRGAKEGSVGLVV